MKHFLLILSIIFISSQVSAQKLFPAEKNKKYGFIEKGYLREVGYKFDQWLDLVFMQLVLEEEE